MTSSGSASGVDPVAPSEYTSAEMLATLGVSREQFGRHQEQLRRSFLSQDSNPFSPSHLQGYSAASLPFPLNLPPSYPIYPSASFSTPTTRHARPPQLRQSASFSTSHVPKKPEIVAEEFTRAPVTPSPSSFKGKGKGTLDVFVDSRQVKRRQEPESSGSEEDAPLRKMPVFPPSDDYPGSDSSALPSSSPPSSSPLRTPKESSPLRAMHPYASSPTPKPKQQQPPARVDASDQPFILPPGPYSREKPSWSLGALIGQALNASRSGSLTLGDIISYISIIYPHYDRSDQPWMNSIRHSLSLNDAFQKVQEEKSAADTGRNKGKAKLRNGLWRITPGHEECFVGGNFIKKGARGAGPGKNQGKKRGREEDEERSDKKCKAGRSKPSRSLRSSSSTPSSASTQTQAVPHTARSRSSSSSRTIYSNSCGSAAPAGALFRRASSPPSLTASLSTVPSDASLPDPFEYPPSSPIAMEHDTYDSATRSPGSPGSPDLPLALVMSRRNAAVKGRSLSFSSSLQPGFELAKTSDLQSSPQFSMLDSGGPDVNRDLFTRVLASTSSAHASSSHAGPSTSPKPARLLFPPPSSSALEPSSSPVRPTTPPPRQTDSGVTLSPVRTPMSHKGLHMSPSRSLAHYKSSLDPEWKAVARRTPPPRDQGDAQAGEDTVLTTPRRLIFPSAPPQASPFRTPARPTKQRHQRGYDPYDPNTLLADELASIRDANESQESPGGFFGKEGRKLMYDSPGVPSRSHWRFRDEF